MRRLIRRSGHRHGGSAITGRRLAAIPGDGSDLRNTELDDCDGMKVSSAHTTGAATGLKGWDKVADCRRHQVATGATVTTRKRMSLAWESLHVISPLPTR